MWKEISNFGEGKYEIDENGLIRNTVTGKFLKGSVFNTGYRVVTLTENSVKKKFKIHRLVATAFLPNPNNYPVVMHLDNNKLNCSKSNLKWGTYSENNAQAIRDKLNTVPRPDNRKMYRLDNELSPISIDGLGIKNIADTIGYDKTISALRKYVARKSNIPYGDFSGWSIKRV